MENTDRYIGRAYRLTSPDRFCIVTESLDDETVRICYVLGKEIDSGIYYLDSIKKSLLKREERATYDFIPMYAKILDVQNSINGFGNKQRKLEFVDSVLRILKLNNYDDNENQPYFTLQTGRADGTIVRIFTVDTRLILPPITPNDVKKLIKRFETGDKIIANKNEPCGLFSIGDEFVIQSIVKNPSSIALNILTLKNNKKETIVTYAKYFKNK